MSGIQAQWGLESTSNSTLTVARGLLAATTSDNVQPLALLACERFGNTLVVCPETINKVEKIIVPSPPAAYVQFLKAYVGFFNDDCATYLGTTAAGVQFLGLAAALSTTMDDFEATKAVSGMMRTTATDLTLIPSLKHIEALLASVKQRCHRAGFATTVAGWQTMLTQSLILGLDLEVPEDRGETDDNRIRHEVAFRMFETHPTGEMIGQLVDLYRRCASRSDSSIIGATIKTTYALPWIMALTKWCLGHPPSLVIEDGLRIWDDPNSNIRIIVPKPNVGTWEVLHTMPTMQIHLHHDVGTRLDALITDDLSTTIPDWRPRRWKGMVEPRTYAVLRLQEPGLQGIDVRQALTLSVPLLARCITGAPRAIRQTPVALQLSTLVPRLTHVDFSRSYRIFFPDEPPDWSVDFAPHDFDGGLGLSDFQFDSLINLSLDLLVVCFLDDPQLLHASRRRPRSYLRDFSGTLRQGKLFDLHFGVICALARDILGHTPDDASFDLRLPSILMSSGMGQVVYPHVFESLNLRTGRHYDLVTLQGTLRYQHQSFLEVISPFPTAEQYEDADEMMPAGNFSFLDGNLLGTRRVVVAENRFGDKYLTWVLTLEGLDTLQAELAVKSRSNPSAFTQCSPFAFHDDIRECFVAEYCPHPHNLPFEAEPPPSEVGRDTNAPIRVIRIVQAAGEDDLRLFAVAYKSEAACLVRKRACIGCCIQFCLENEIGLLIT